MDSVSKMNTRELKAALREERKKREDDRKTSDKAIFTKEKKISELEAQLRYQEPPTQEQLAAVSLEPLKKKLFEQVLLVQFHLDEAVKVVVQAQKVKGATFPQLQEWAQTHYEQLAPIGELFEELDQALNNCGPDRPESTGM
jgi:septal ring factor EnvC (AmiA/AmiB activator)